jgi:hypothetical protein
LALFLTVSVLHAETLRLAVWHEALSRNGPGLLLRDLKKGDPIAAAMAEAVRMAEPDILVLTKIDYDASGLALSVFADMAGGYGNQMPLRPNTGVPTGLDLNGDGTSGGYADAQSYGRFPGEGGMAVLSRFQLDRDGIQSFGGLLWKDLPGTHITSTDAGYDLQVLSSGGHWVVPIWVGGSTVTLMIGHSMTPVFDGPEDRNGRRNLDELRLWEQIISDLQEPFVFAVNTNLDPDRGDGYRDAMAGFLATSGLQDTVPGFPTAHWERPGPMRVSYLLPSADLKVDGARVWPVLPGFSHSLITLDIVLPDTPQP